MIANPNKPNIFQCGSHEDKCADCTETAGNPEINPVLLNLLSSSKVVLRSLLKPSHGAKAALRCVHGQAEQIAFNCNVTNRYIYKYKHPPPNSWLQVCPSSPPCSSTRDCSSSPSFNSVLVSESEQEMLQELETRLKHLHSPTPINNNLQSPFLFSVLLNELLFQD